MIKTGLVSISFRSLAVEEIVELVNRCQLDSIEWGGDVHAPHGDLDKAKYVYKLCNDNGIDLPAYGSYYRLCGDVEFLDVLGSAIELKTPIIRVWAGNKGSKDADAKYRQDAIEDCQRISDLAQKEGIKIAFEYHGNSLTDTNESAKQLLDEINNPNVRTFWQPPNNTSFEYRMAGLKTVSEYIENIHVFSWINQVRYELAKREDDWLKYFEVISKLKGDRYAMIEFVKDDIPEQLIEDARTLRRWLRKID